MEMVKLFGVFKLFRWLSYGDCDAAVVVNLWIWSNYGSMLLMRYLSQEMATW